MTLFDFATGPSPRVTAPRAQAWRGSHWPAPAGQAQCQLVSCWPVPELPNRCDGSPEPAASSRSPLLIGRRCLLPSLRSSLLRWRPALRCALWPGLLPGPAPAPWLPLLPVSTPRGVVLTQPSSDHRSARTPMGRRALSKYLKYLSRTNTGWALLGTQHRESHPNTETRAQECPHGTWSQRPRTRETPHVHPGAHDILRRRRVQRVMRYSGPLNHISCPRAHRNGLLLNKYIRNCNGSCS